MQMDKLAGELGTIRITIQRGRREKRKTPKQWPKYPEASVNAPQKIFKKEAISLSTR